MATTAVKDVMTPQPTAIASDATVVEAARRMSSEDVGSLPVVDSDKHSTMRFAHPPRPRRRLAGVSWPAVGVACCNDRSQEAPYISPIGIRRVSDIHW